jgi:predicted extracellular nuclease
VTQRSTPRSAVLGLTVGALAAGGLAAAPAALAATGDARITEIHYDNAGTDTSEAIEVTAASAADLTGLSVVLYNGKDGAVYDTVPVVADGDGIAVVSPGSIQNGSPDGVALVASDQRVLEFLSYEGALTATSGPAAGMTSTDIGVTEPDTTPVGRSLQRTPGTDTWTGPRTATFGAVTTAAEPEPAPQPGLACDVPTVPVGSVQGSGDASPVAGQVVTVAGTVVADLQSGGLAGFHVQDAGDGSPATSDGVFVHSGDAPAVDLGDSVVVRGTVTEFHGATELTDVTLGGCGTAPLPAPAPLSLPATDEQREVLEGMLVAPVQELTVTEVYDLNRYGEVLLAQGGRLISPTEAAAPGAAAQDVLAQNAARSITLDDGRSTNLATAGEAPPFLTREDPVRVGDTATIGQPVVLGHSFDAWRLQPSDGTAEGTTFPATNPRPAAPPAVGGDLRIADFNVLNYFVDVPTATDKRPRGAANAAELAQQQTKIVTALAALDADVVTLHEIENSAVLTPGDDHHAVETLLAALEAADGHDWDYVRAHEDTDVITNAIVFRTDRVTAVGGPRVPADLSAFANARTPIAQTFEADGEAFTIIANHLKSKGSGAGPGNIDNGDGQGASNADRVAQARVLVGFAAQLVEETGDPDVLLTGDFNAYRNEDPIRAVTEAGYTDMAPVLAPGQYSYVFDGGSGSLDHVFASRSIRTRLTGLGVWDINAVESFAYEYDGYEPFYAPDPYRASDHNPTVFGLSTQAADGSTAAAVSDTRPLRGDRVTVTGSGFAPGEEVTASLPSRNRGHLGSAVAGADGRVSIPVTVPVALPAGDQEVLLSDTSGTQASTGFQLRSLLEDVRTRLLRWWQHG